MPSGSSAGSGTAAGGSATGGGGLGIGFIPATSRQVGRHAPVAWVRMDAPDCHRVLTLVWNRGAYFSEAALRLKEFITSRPFMTHHLPEPRRDRGRDTP
ncbi:hypothetical protein K7395_25150 [Streptomyces filamentosus]|uniref:LysR substrate-binding domain-containing protein n=1 Tax=Streptomyces filamentosus TaxID=67294 RepID=A0ABY4UZL2_STRFL|nr:MULTISPECIES: hypothetical protein [Streptomyces]USC49777.1 hypothetical protein K7395_25150 [Streptomyces filamentosus]